MNTEKRRFIWIISRLSIALFVLAFAYVVYDASYGHFLSGKGYGPGAYYYTDVPNWQEVFMNSPYLGFSNPFISMLFFVVWGYLMYRLLLWVTNK